MRNIPDWVLYNLERYNNCLLEKKLVKKCGVPTIIKELETIGFKGSTIELRNGSYIAEVKQVDPELRLSLNKF